LLNGRNNQPGGGVPSRKRKKGKFRAQGTGIVKRKEACSAAKKVAERTIDRRRKDAQKKGEVFFRGLAGGGEESRRMAISEPPTKKTWPSVRNRRERDRDNRLRSIFGEPESGKGRWVGAEKGGTKTVWPGSFERELRGSSY